MLQVSGSQTHMAWALTRFSHFHASAAEPSLVTTAAHKYLGTSTSVWRDTGIDVLGTAYSVSGEGPAA